MRGLGEASPTVDRTLTTCHRKIVENEEHTSPPDHRFIWRLA